MKKVWIVFIIMTFTPCSNAELSLNAAYWNRPLKPFSLKKSFTPGAHRWLAGHRGIDLKGEAGQQIFAPAQGTVVFVGKIAEKEVLSIEHHDGLRSTYEPVQSQLRAGDFIKRGQPIATLKSDGHCEGQPCLHWGVKRQEEYFNPLLFLQLQHPILLPL